MANIVIEMEKEDCENLERIHMMYNYNKDVIQRIMETNMDNSNILESETFKEYDRRASERFAELELMKQEIERKYVPETISKFNYSWFVDFASCTITFAIN